MSEVLALGDVADVVAGVGFPKDMQGGQDGAIPVFKVGDISAAWLQGKSLLNDSRNYLSAEEAKSLGKCVPAGATVFAKIGEALRLNRRVMLGRDALVDNNVMGLVPKRDRIAPKYLYYFMQTVDLGELSRSTTVPSIRKSDVVEISIPVPALAVQGEIVAELEKQFSRLDEAVANLQRVKANLKRYKASVFTAAVKGMLVPLEASLARGSRSNPKTGADLLLQITSDRAESRNARQSAPELIDFTHSLESLPVGWAWATLDQIAQEGRPIIYGIIKPGQDTPDGVPYVRVTEMKDGFVDVKNLKRASPAREEKFKRARLIAGDLLISKDGTIGRVAMVPPELEGGNVTQHVMRAPIHRFMNREFVMLAIRSEMCQRWLVVASRTIIRTLVKQMRVRLVPFFHGLHRRLALQG